MTIPDLISDYREFSPPPLLGDYLSCVWTRTAGRSRVDAQARVVVDGCADIVWIGDSEPLLVGPATRPVVTVLPPGSSIVGARFRPGFVPSLLGLPAHEILDQEILLREVWHEDISCIANCTAEPGSAEAKLTALTAMLTSRLPKAVPTDAVVLNAIATLLRRPNARVGRLSRFLGISERHVRRRFEYAVGYGPKMFSVIQRFQRALTLGRKGSPTQPSLTNLAAEAGYSDQSHMTREFTRFAGIPPSSMLPNEGRSGGVSVSFKTERRT